MPHNPDYYKGLAREMQEANRERNEIYSKIEKILHFEFELPKAVRDLPGVRKVVSTKPFNAVRAATNVLAASMPRFDYRPLVPDEPNRTLANRYERALDALFAGANMRKNATILRDIIRSAFVYDEICCEVIDIRYQDQALQTLTERSRDYSMQYGPFALNVVNPKFVNTLTSTYGTEAVLTVETKPAHEVLHFWGKAAGQLRSFLEGKIDPKTQNYLFRWVTVYNFIDKDYRYVWCIPTQTLTAAPPTSSEAIDLLPLSDNELGFINWVSIVGGSNLEDREEDRRIPLLYAIAKSKLWENHNITETLALTRTIRNFAAPTERVTGPQPENAQSFDHSDIDTREFVQSGHSVEDLPPRQLDIAMLTVADRIAATIDEATVSRVLQGGDIPSQTAFATVSAIIQAAVTNITPYKDLAESGLARVGELILRWVKFMDEELVVFSEERNSQGEQLKLVPAEIPSQYIRLKVELSADTPTDKLQNINAASIAVANLGYSKAAALQDIGVNDADRMLDDSRREQLKDELFRMAVEKLQSQHEMDMAVRQQRLLQFQQTAGLGGPGGPQQPIQPERPVTEPPTGAEDIEGLGQGFNPALGGQPFAVANPGATRERQTGQTQVQEAL